MNAKVTYLSDGKVELRFENGDYYRGDFPNNTITGQGIMRYANGMVYEGGFDHDRFHGYGKAVYTDGRTYEGNWTFGEWDGFGKAYFASNRETYEGMWSHNLRDGHGRNVFRNEDGSLDVDIDADFHDDQIDGHVKKVWGDGASMEGTAKGHVFYGKVRFRLGSAYGVQEGWIYEGEMPLIDNSYVMQDEAARFTSTDGTVYEGPFVNGQRNGRFRITYPDGRVEEAEFVKGERISAVKSFSAGAAPEVKPLRPDPDDSRYLHVHYSGNEKYSPQLRPYFENVIGMEPVKEQLDRMYKRFQIDAMRQQALGVEQAKQGYYFIITGNPGTGKTTVARIIGRMLHDMKILPGDVFVEVDRAKLVGEYIGQTATRTAAVIESARGGTLFIDEAYTLYRKGNEKDFGPEAIDTLLKDMEDHRGEYCVIMAGYADEMREMIRDANPGLASRFDHKITIGDYSADELTDILVSMAGQKQFLVRAEARPVILAMIEREKVDDTFDNARCARRLLDQAIERQALRLSENIDAIGPEDLQVLKAEDFGELGQDQSTLDSCMADLESLIGLEAVKAEIRSFVQAVRIRNESRKRGLAIASNPIQMNMVFTGNPGTGKTTVARLLSKIYYHLGLLKRPDVFVECVRADLVGRYQGETALKVKDVVRSALGGILFIDEAYSLVMGENDSFGIEAVNTLVSEIENNRENLAVILAGYTDEMHRFLDTNPGLRSRLPREVEFADYGAEDLARIFRRDLTRRGYEVRVTDAALEGLLAREMTKKDFGNARGVRNLCDAVIAKHNERINAMDFSSLTNEDFITISDQDILI